MIQRSSVSTIVATAEVAESFRGHLRNDQIAALRRAFALPSTLKGFLLFVAGVLVVCAGLGMQVLLSAQIRQAEVENIALRGQVERIEQLNTETMWATSQATSLDAIRKRALEIGFVPAEEPLYVVRAAEAPAYFGAMPAPLDDDGKTGLNMPQLETTVDADMAWTSGLVSTLRQRVAEAIAQLAH